MKKYDREVVIADYEMLELGYEPKAIIVAQYAIDRSDVMSDLFSHTIDKKMLLRFSRHTRDVFSELRKAAARFSETAHLASDEKTTDEHREKYSMGAGYYLKRGYRHSTGWEVRKISHNWKKEAAELLAAASFLPELLNPQAFRRGERNAS